MARKFGDTSAIIKLYRVEPNSALVQAQITPSDDLLIAEITPLEFRSAFYGLVRQKIISVTDAQVYINGFQNNLPQYTIVRVDAAVLARAATLLDLYSASISLRPLDAMQLACALEEHARNPLDAFVTTDMVLANVAAAEGLTVKP